MVLLHLPQSKKNNLMSLQEYYINKLKDVNAFWSYDSSVINSIDEEVLIENVLIHLEFEDIILLFNNYPKSKIKAAWINRLVRQEPMYHNLNNMIALLFFNIKNPKRYLQRKKKEILKSMA